MAALIKTANGLKLSKTVISSSTQKVLAQWQKSILIPPSRMCSGKNDTDKNVAIKSPEKADESKSDSARSIHERTAMKHLTRTNKYVMYFWGIKGKYKTVDDVPDLVPTKELRNAFDKQRIVGCTASMIIMFIIAYITVKYEKWAIANSDNYGERHWNNTISSGNYVGQPRPPQAPRVKEG